jgi:hypothetical protein
MRRTKNVRLRNLANKIEKVKFEMEVQNGSEDSESAARYHGKNCEVNMRGLLRMGAAASTALSAAALLAGCVGTPSLNGGFGAPSLVALQEMCGAQPVNYGNDAQPVYSALFDAYVASRHGKISKPDFCAFQASIAQQYAALGAGGGATRGQWATFFNEQRAKALSWRAAVDPTLRAG